MEIYIKDERGEKCRVKAVYVFKDGAPVHIKKLECLLIIIRYTKTGGLITHFDDAMLAETLQSALPNPEVYTAVRLMDPTLKYHYCLVYQMSTAGVSRPSREMIASGFSNWHNGKFPVCVQIKTVGDTITVSVKGLT